MSLLSGAISIGYRRRASPLHAARGTVAAAYGFSIALAALLVQNPILLGALLAAVLAAAAGAGVARSLLYAMRVGALPILGLCMIVNVLVSHDGLTVLARLGDWGVLGQVDPTLEAVVYGLVVGLRLMIVSLATLLVVCAADPDDLLRACRRVSPHSALTAAISTRLVSVLADDARRLAEAQRCRPMGEGEGPPDVWRSCERRSPAPWSARSTSRRCWRCAATQRRASRTAAPRPLAPRPRLPGQRRSDPDRDRHRAGQRSSPLRRLPARAHRQRPGHMGARGSDRRGRDPAVPRPARDRAMSVLEIERVTYSYPGAAGPALREVSLTVERGEFCVLAGLSGSGKSTLLRAVAGLVPHFHGGTFSGRVSVAGIDTREGGPAEIGAVAGTLLQDPETQIVMSTVRAELALAIENRGQGEAAVARAVEEIALALGIGELLDRSTGELSGGELQRVALAAALVARPPLVLLDEPTSQLDPVAGDELIWQLRRLNQESDTAVLLIEHRLERCLAAADRVVAMDDGEIVCDGDPRSFLEWAAARRAAPADAGRPPARRAGLRPGAERRQAGPRDAAPRRATAGSPQEATERGAEAPPALGGRCSATEPASSARDARRLARAARRAGDPARRRPVPARRRGGRADGPQRRRQVDAAAPRRRAARADARTPCSGRGGWRCCCRTPATTSCTSDVERGGAGASARAVGLAGLASATRVTSREASDSGWRSRSCSAARATSRDRPGRAHARDGPRRQAAARGLAPRQGGRGGRGDRGHPRLRVRRRVRDARGAARRTVA